MGRVLRATALALQAIGAAAILLGALLLGGPVVLVLVAGCLAMVAGTLLERAQQ